MGRYENLTPAEQNLRNFEEMMELVDRYPVKKTEPAPLLPPYENQRICYFASPK